ncbi:MAG: hypothetical protein HUJ54_11725 [Erysipelotrichaceae bacterium]|nr:hypothetical protein [Erysipelotrichaceae bacterium]
MDRTGLQSAALLSKANEENQAPVWSSGIFQAYSETESLFAAAVYNSEQSI